MIFDPSKTPAQLFAELDKEESDARVIMARICDPSLDAIPNQLDDFVERSKNSIGYKMAEARLKLAEAKRRYLEALIEQGD